MDFFWKFIHFASFKRSLNEVALPDASNLKVQAQAAQILAHLILSPCRQCRSPTQLSGLFTSNLTKGGIFGFYSPQALQCCLSGGWRQKCEPCFLTLSSPHTAMQRIMVMFGSSAEAKSIIVLHFDAIIFYLTSYS